MYLVPTRFPLSTLEAAGCAALKVILFFIILLTPTQFIFADSPREQKIKAAVAFYIAKFIQWPVNIEKPRTSLRLCTIEGSEMTPFLNEVFDGKTINKLPVNVLNLMSTDGLMKSACDIIFVSRDQSEKNNSDIAALSGHPVLSICEHDKLTWGACMAQIFPSDNRAKIAFDINLAARAGLKVSSELLALAVTRSGSR